MNTIRRKPEVMVGLMIALIALVLIIVLISAQSHSLPYVQNY